MQFLLRCRRHRRHLPHKARACTSPPPRTLSRAPTTSSHSTSSARTAGSAGLLAGLGPTDSAAPQLVLVAPTVPVVLTDTQAHSPSPLLMAAPTSPKRRHHSDTYPMARADGPPQCTPHMHRATRFPAFPPHCRRRTHPRTWTRSPRAVTAAVTAPPASPSVTTATAASVREALALALARALAERVQADWAAAHHPRWPRWCTSPTQPR